MPSHHSPRRPRRRILTPTLLVLLVPLVWRTAWPTPAAAQGRQPSVWAEGILTEPAPYVEQTVIYTLRIHHRGGIKSLDPEPFNAPSLSIVKIDGPVTEKEWVDNQRVYYSDFRYAITPLKADDIEIPPVVVAVKRAEQPPQQTSTYPGWPRPQPQQPTGPEEFDLTAPALTLNAKPRAEEDYPWLPLYGLTLEARFDQYQKARTGDPLSLTLIQTAWGAAGDQLPALAAYLESPDFKVYADRPETDRGLSETGNLLQGTRGERFTLIPRRHGDLTIPAVRVPWWNLAQDKQAWVEWPGLRIQIAPPEGYVEPETAEPRPEAPPTKALEVPPEVWMLLIGLISFILGWWVRADRPGPAALLAVLKQRLDRRRQRVKQRAQAKAAAAGQTAAAQTPTGQANAAGQTTVTQPAAGTPPRKPRFTALRTGLQRLRPGHWRPLLARRIDTALPHWVHVRRYRRQVETARTPQEVERTLRIYAHHVLGLSINASLAAIAHAMVDAYPKIKEDVLRDRLARLDAALYAPEADPDFRFRTWMRDFRRILRAIGNREPLSPDRIVTGGLPPINPRRPPRVREAT